MVSRNIEGKVWWRIDRSFEVPAIFVGLRLDHPTIQDTLENNLIFRLLYYYLYDSLSDKFQE